MSVEENASGQASEPDDAREEDDLLDGEESELDEGFSLEELSRSYATALGHTALGHTALGQDEANSPEGDASGPGDSEDEIELFDSPEEPVDDVDANCAITPLSIVEAILFVGKPDSQPVSADEIAALMRGVRKEEIAGLVDELNLIYEQTGRAIRIAESAQGFAATLAEDMEPVRNRFYGEVREVSLNQVALDCLALIAYQPGVSREQLEQQRGQPSGGVLNQLVRRQLIEMRREETGAKPTQHYYPTHKLAELAGLDSLEDLPQVEEFD